MRALAFTLAVAAALSGCAATGPRPAPLSGAEVVQLAKEGRSAQDIIAELKRTDTVLPLSAADIVALRDEGVPTEVLDYLQAAQIADLRWRDRNAGYWYGSMHRGFAPCPWPYPGMRRPYAGGPWGC